MTKKEGFLIICLQCKIVPKNFYIIGQVNGITLKCSNCKNLQYFPFVEKEENENKRLQRK